MRRFGIIKCQILYCGRDIITPLRYRSCGSCGANVVYKHQSRAHKRRKLD
ncbi:hypothetical protein CIPAW_15G120800 [Carya illinoinensis]|uniref:Uncharacterized protein n=1 Tax=Carya illinoinensis TaxID=32201 RepID=A0A8T1NEE6_CARIL|nr:hypothetical protein CIPAW_15G120800 [Carya illinoinensis]